MAMALPPFFFNVRHYLLSFLGITMVVDYNSGARFGQGHGYSGSNA